MRRIPRHQGLAAAEIRRHLQLRHGRPFGLTGVHETRCLIFRRTLDGDSYALAMQQGLDGLRDDFRAAVIIRARGRIDDSSGGAFIIMPSMHHPLGALRSEHVCVERHDVGSACTDRRVECCCLGQKAGRKEAGEDELALLQRGGRVYGCGGL